MLVDLFVGGVGVDIEEMVRSDVLSVDLAGVVLVVDYVCHHDLDISFRVFVGVELSDVKGSVVVLSLDFVQGFFDVDGIARRVRTHIDHHVLLRSDADYLLQFV